MAASLQWLVNIQALCGLTGRSTGQIAAGFANHNLPVNFNVRLLGQPVGFPLVERCALAQGFGAAWSARCVVERQKQKTKQPKQIQNWFVLCVSFPTVGF